MWVSVDLPDPFSWATWPTKNKSTYIGNINGECDDQTKANILNHHFSTFGAKLGSAFEGGSIPTFGPVRPPTFNLTSITPDTISNILGDLCLSKSCGLDGLTARLLKDAGETIVQPLTHIFNQSITKKHFPTEWKTACVSALFKDRDRSDPTNYRPISLLSIVSKMLEKIIHEELYAFLRYQNFFDEHQSGFRKGHSMTTWRICVSMVLSSRNACYWDLCGSVCILI